MPILSSSLFYPFLPNLIYAPIVLNCVYHFSIRILMIFNQCACIYNANNSNNKNRDNRNNPMKRHTFPNIFRFILRFIFQKNIRMLFRRTKFTDNVVNRSARIYSYKFCNITAKHGEMIFFFMDRAGKHQTDIFQII